EDFPAVGDWVSLTIYDPDFSIIHHILPRSLVLTRQAAGQPTEKQVIAANIDYALLVQATDRDFNLNRLERYLTICHASGVSPIIVLTKTDLIDKPILTGLIDKVRQREKGIPVFAISNETMEGLDALKRIIEKGKTFCMLGSSGVGKSTIINRLSGRAAMQTGAISDSTGKGRHLTSHRELILLENGGILIDNPGMREVGMADQEEGLDFAFDLILQRAPDCRFKDCTHANEAGCAVIAAVESGELDSDVLDNYLKLQREISRFETSVAEKRKKDKQFGKILKDYLKRDVKGKGI
ncbi:MAG TPA: ribosome small subunit-dependent GTPase A, partial [Bacteroidales bacterium]|nr:ribosome small subunit-dependent GTPase A [Bacteroidales bacterium]